MRHLSSNAELDRLGAELGLGRLSDQCVEDFAACVLDEIRERIAALEAKRMRVRQLLVHGRAAPSLHSTAARTAHGSVRPPNADVGMLVSRPMWPEPGYDVSEEITDPTNWAVNPDASLAGIPDRRSS